MTATDYLAARRKARENGVDKPPFKAINEELKRSPDSQRRLAMELLETFRNMLAEGKDPGPDTLMAFLWADLLEGSMRDAYLDVTEDLIRRAFRLMGKNKEPRRRFPRFSLPVNDGLFMLRRLDPNRFQTLMSELKAQCSAAGDQRQELLAKIERPRRKREGS